MDLLCKTADFVVLLKAVEKKAKSFFIKGNFLPNVRAKFSKI